MCMIPVATLDYIKLQMRKILFLFLLISLPIWSVFSQTLNDSLIVYYPLDGNADDVGPNNLDGTYFASSATDCAGNIGGATYFDGVDDYIELPIDTLLQPQLPVSFSFKIKFPSYPGPKIFFTNDYDHNNYYGFWLNITQSGYIHASYGDGGPQNISNRRTANANIKLNLNIWYDITVIIKGSSNVDFYINCESESASFVGNGGTLAYSSGNSNSTIGRFARPSSTFAYFNGYLDEFRMWNRALTPQDVEILHNSPCILSDSISATICQGDSFTVNNINFHKVAGIYNDTIYNATSLGCDSIITLDLTVNPKKFKTLNQSICEGNTFNFNGNHITTAGTYMDTLLSSASCDSIITLNLSVFPKSFATLNEEICDDENYNFNGSILNSSGTYIDTLTAINGCDSIITLHLNVLPKSFTSLQAEICGGEAFNFNGNILNSSGTYIDTLAAANGCDSIITLNLNVLSSSFTSLQAEICQGDTFSFNGNKLTATGIYTDTLVAANLCDSIITLDLNVSPLSFTTLNKTICEDSFYFFDGKKLKTSGTYFDTLLATNSCDSIVTLNLTVMPKTFGTLNQTICQGDTFDFNGNLVTTTGTYKDTILSNASCDSIVTLNLSVLPISSYTLNDEICEGGSFDFNGNILTSSGTYVDTLIAANGCDSIVTLNLNVLPRSFAQQQTEICQGDTFDFNGSKLTTTGIYSDTLVAANLCDSIITLDLNVKPLSYSTINDSIFSNGSYLFNGKNITKAGIYIDTLIASNSCDSIITLYLNIKYPSGSITKEICPGDTLLIHDSIYFKNGTYIDTLFGAAFNGADSLFYIFIKNLPLEECYPLLLEIPNVFTPNSDGINDVFMVRGENIISYEIKIYNRWGNLVYSSNNIKLSWDGRNGGDSCSEGNYFYLVQCNGVNGEELSKEGSLTLIR